MSNYTTYKALEKPLSTEKYNIAVANRNADLIDTELNKLEQKNLSLDETLAAESDRAKDAETKLTVALDAEVQRAQTAENANAEAIRTERMRSSNVEADLQSDLEDEINRAQAAEQLLDTGLNTVTESVNTVDSRVTALDEKIDGLSAEDIGAVTPEDLSSYLPLQGGTITGPLEVQGTVTATAFAGNASSASKAASSEMLAGWEDTRNTATKPNDYNEKIRPVGIKQNTTTGIPDGGTYATLVGMRGWKDSSGGKAHELGFTANGKLYHRVGDTDTWEPWRELAHTDDIAAAGGSASATKLATARNIQTNLASTSPASFDGTQNVTPGVTGILPLANGGTGAADAANARSKLGITPANIGALPTSGGTITGNLRLKGSGNYGNKLNFGDGEYVYLYEYEDDSLEIKVSNTLKLSADDIIITAPIDGDITGNAATATSATQDGNGNNIVNTYATKAEVGNISAMTLVGVVRLDCYDAQQKYSFANTSSAYEYILTGEASSSSSSSTGKNDFYRVTYITGNTDSSTNCYEVYNLGTDGTTSTTRFSVDKTYLNVTVTIAKGCYAWLRLYRLGRII